MEFVEIENFYTYDEPYNSKDSYIAAVYIRYDSEYSTYQRRIYSIMDLLGDVGGLYSSLFSIGYLLICFLNHRMFISAILKRIYQVKNYQNE
jgi:hypothetical protein